MAEAHTAEENAATETLQRHFGTLLHSIQNSSFVASHLYSAKLITWPTMDKLRTVGLSGLEKNFELLSSVHSRLLTNPTEIDTFIQIIELKLQFQELAKGMRETYQGRTLYQE